MTLTQSLPRLDIRRPKNAFEPPARLRLRTMALIRWISILGQVTAVAIVTYGLGYTVPLVSVALVIAASVLVNLVVTAQRRRRVHLSNRDAALYLGYDVVQLSVLLYLVGGLDNPFTVLLLGPPIIGAAILDRRHTAWLIGLTVVAVTVLALWHEPIPPIAGDRIANVKIETFGWWMAICLSAVMVGAYVWRVAAEARAVGEALASTQMALAREQQVSSVGALAAATAHELGTPLGTISLIAGELADELPPESPLAGEVALLVGETRRCRRILASLSRRRPDAPSGQPDEVVEITRLALDLAETHRRDGIRIDVEDAALDDTPVPLVERTPELSHALANLVDNAVRFASRQVVLRLDWSHERVRLTILDDGPGFAPGLIAKLGEPYLADRSRAAGREAHLGLGVFIAKTLLDRQGATLSFANGTNCGAKVVISWRRSMSHA